MRRKETRGRKPKINKVRGCAATIDRQFLAWIAPKLSEEVTFSSIARAAIDSCDINQICEAAEAKSKKPDVYTAFSISMPLSLADRFRMTAQLHRMNYREFLEYLLNQLDKK